MSLVNCTTSDGRVEEVGSNEFPRSCTTNSYLKHLRELACHFYSAMLPGTCAVLHHFCLLQIVWAAIRSAGPPAIKLHLIVNVCSVQGTYFGWAPNGWLYGSVNKSLETKKSQ